MNWIEGSIESYVRGRRVMVLYDLLATCGARGYRTEHWAQSVGFTSIDRTQARSWDVGNPARAPCGRGVSYDLMCHQVIQYE
jgi:hypothetical protein